jgi:hypothetical protein
MMASQNIDLQKDCETYEPFDFEGIIAEHDEELNRNIKNENAIKYVLEEHLTFNKIEIPKDGKITIIAFSEILENMFRSLILENLVVEFTSFDYLWNISYGVEYEKRQKVDGEHNWGLLTFTLVQTDSSYYLDLIPGGNREINRFIVSEIKKLLENHYIINI